MLPCRAVIFISCHLFSGPLLSSCLVLHVDLLPFLREAHALHSQDWVRVYLVNMATLASCGHFSRGCKQADTNRACNSL